MRQAPALTGDAKAAGVGYGVSFVTSARGARYGSISDPSLNPNEYSSISDTSVGGLYGHAAGV